MAQVQLQGQQHETPGHLQGAREGAAGSQQAGTNLQQTHDGDVIYRVPNTTESQVQVDAPCCGSCASGLPAAPVSAAVTIASAHQQGPALPAALPAVAAAK